MQYLPNLHIGALIAWIILAGAWNYDLGSRVVL